MNRKVTNLIRFFMDECLPPIIRDNRVFMYPFFYLAYRGKNISETMDFKKNVYRFDSKDYAKFYSGLNSISRNRLTDLNQKSINGIIEALGSGVGSALDLGCGNGYLLRLIKNQYPHLLLAGVDVKKPQSLDGISFLKGNIEDLPCDDKSYDAVICTHVLEHCLNPLKVIAQIKRVACKKVIIVVPKQRFYYYTLDEHVNFYYFKEKLIYEVGLKDFKISNIEGDWFYVGQR